MSRDGHFRMPNPEVSESQTIQNTNCNINRIIGTIDKATLDNFGNVFVIIQYCQLHNYVFLHQVSPVNSGIHSP